MSIPTHIAIIMDGNRRWAQARGDSVYDGYKAGARIVNDVLLESQRLGVEFVTVYAFSSENWNRPVKEIAGLMNIAMDWLTANKQFLLDNGICCKMIGNRGLVPYYFLNKVSEVEEYTKDCDKLKFQIAMSYGSRDEIMRAVLRMLRDDDDVSNISETWFEKFLDTAAIPDPDLLIRTGGEKRLSNYMLWQLAYTELRFVDTLWPDFTCEMLRGLVEEFGAVHRRFGCV